MFLVLSQKALNKSFLSETKHKSPKGTVQSSRNNIFVSFTSFTYLHVIKMVRVSSLDKKCNG